MGMFKSMKRSGKTFARELNELNQEMLSMYEIRQGARSTGRKLEEGIVNRQNEARSRMRDDMRRARQSIKETKAAAKTERKALRTQLRAARRGNRETMKEVRKQLPYSRPLYNFGAGKMRQLKNIPQKIRNKISNIPTPREMARKVFVATSLFAINAVAGTAKLMRRGFENVRDKYEQRQINKLEKLLDKMGYGSLNNYLSNEFGEKQVPVDGAVKQTQTDAQGYDKQVDAGFESNVEPTVFRESLYPDKMYEHVYSSKLDSAPRYPWDSNELEDRVNNSMYDEDYAVTEADTNYLNRNARDAMTACLSGEKISQNGAFLHSVVRDELTGIEFVKPQGDYAQNVQAVQGTPENFKNAFVQIAVTEGIEPDIAKQMSERYVDAIYDKNGRPFDKNEIPGRLLSAQAQWQGDIQSGKLGNVNQDYVAAVRLSSDYIFSDYFKSLGDTGDRQTANEILNNTLQNKLSVIDPKTNEVYVAKDANGQEIVPTEEQIKNQLVKVCELKGISDISDNLMQYYSSYPTNVDIPGYVQQNSGMRSFNEAYSYEGEQMRNNRSYGVGEDIMAESNESAIDVEYEG